MIRRDFLKITGLFSAGVVTGLSIVKSAFDGRMTPKEVLKHYSETGTLIWRYKYQNHIAKSRPQGLRIEMSDLNEI